MMHTTNVCSPWAAVVGLGTMWMMFSYSLVVATPRPSIAAKYHGTSAHHLQQQRYLVENFLHFAPLQCNAAVEQATCQSWTGKFGASNTYDQRIVIPCGECVIMDHPGPVVELRDGMDVQGKLVIAPPDASASGGVPLTLRSTLIAVQGVLEIDASTRLVNGSPLVEFILFNDGREDHYFTAIEENAAFCTLVEGCVAGRKSIAVAGGQLKIHGVPPDTPSWLPLHDVIYNDTGNVTMLVLDSAIKDKWGPGAELLITSHTMSWDGHQTRRIKSVVDHPTDLSKAVVELDSPITRPTTEKDDIRFAVEVALLSKNIVWKGVADIPGNEDSELEGGHFWIMHTPTVQQIIEGVELVNFGQQGNLGRYPIHFHLCGDVGSSRVSKNTIRQSNQRCVVVHGTNNLLIEENVAFDTKGHCFLLEDGSETGNQFVRNLGAQTSAPLKVIPDEGLNGSESDQDRPSTFWITNPMNSWVGNVAAGSEAIGFWFELLLRGPSGDYYEGEKPKNSPLTLFKDNVAHSSGTGIRTYPSGYIPSEQAKFEGSRLYRNLHGAFFHISRNYLLQGGVFADNALSLDIDRADTIEIIGTEFIGVSDSFRSLVNEQGFQAACQPGPDGVLIGIEIHTWKDSADAEDTALNGVSFHGYGEQLCGGAFPMSFDVHTKSGLFDYFTSMTNVSFDETSNSFIHFCAPIRNNILDLYITDTDGSLRPKMFGEKQAVTTASLVPQEVSTLMGDNSESLNLLDSDKCIEIPNHCYKYCEGVCFQSVRFEVDAGVRSQEYRLEVCSQSNASACIHIAGGRRQAPGDDNHRATRALMYNAHLPVGEYSAVFVDKDGSKVWPSYAHEVYEESNCINAMPDGFVELEEPLVTRDVCTQLIRNGMVEVNETSSDPIWPWLYRRGGVGPAVGEGIGGSDALQTNVEFDQSATILQFLDNRCMPLLKDRTLELQASIKLVDQNGNAVVCDPETDDCPSIGYGTNGRFVSVATVSTVDGDGYQLAIGRMTVGDDMLAASEVTFFASAPQTELRMLLDDVSMTLVDGWDESVEGDIKDTVSVLSVMAESEDDLAADVNDDPSVDGMATMATSSQSISSSSSTLAVSSSTSWNSGRHSLLAGLFTTLIFVCSCAL